MPMEVSMKITTVQKFLFSMIKPRNFSPRAPVSSFPSRNPMNILFPERTTEWKPSGHLIRPATVLLGNVVCRDSNYII